MSLDEGQARTRLSARGSLERADHISSPAQRRRIRLLIELGVIFVAAPLAIRHAIFAWHIPLPVVLQPVLLGFVLYLLWDPTFRLLSEVSGGLPWRLVGRILLTFAIVAAIMMVVVKAMMPSRFLALPLDHPRLWATIMIAYPLVSVIPQELVYRTFFFHRFGPLFGEARWVAIIVNGLLFGFAHIIFGSLVSVGLTTLLGLLVAWRYDRARSYWGAWLEHSLYGCLVFTIGLGSYFFTGVATLR